MLESPFHFIEKETPTQVFSCEICDIFKNNFFYRTPPVAAPVFETTKLRKMISYQPYQHARIRALVRD